MSLRQIFTALLLVTAGTAALSSPIVTLVSTVNVAVKSGASGAAGAQTAGFSSKHATAGLFTDTFTFMSSGEFAFINGSLTTIGSTPKSDIDFISASLNGIGFILFKTDDEGVFESTETALFAKASLTGPYILVVNGRAGEGLPDGTRIAATYGGTFNLADGSRAVPEPASSALVSLGLAGLGFARRRRVA